MTDQSTHSKCLELIALIKRHSSLTIDELIHHIHEKVGTGNSSSFVYFRRDEHGHSRTYPCGRSSVLRQLQLLRGLGLVSDFEPLELTSKINAAANRKQVEEILNDKLLIYLERRGCPFSRIKESIENNKISDPHNLYVDIGPRAMSEYDFRRCLFMLSKINNNIFPSQRKIYEIRT